MTSPEMLQWQIKKINGELGLLADHYLDPSCPCMFRDPIEKCPPKHLNKIASYATETANMTSDAKLGEELKKLAHEANTFYDMERKKLCGGKEDEINLAAWSRSKRKALEPYQFACVVETNPASSHLSENSSNGGGKMPEHKVHLKAESEGERPSRVLAEFNGFLVEIPPEVAKGMFHNPPEIPKVQKWAAGWARGMTDLIAKQMREAGTPLSEAQREAATRGLYEYLWGGLPSPSLPGVPPALPAGEGGE